MSYYLNTINKFDNGTIGIYPVATYITINNYEELVGLGFESVLAMYKEIVDNSKGFSVIFIDPRFSDMSVSIPWLSSRLISDGFAIYTVNRLSQKVTYPIRGFEICVTTDHKDFRYHLNDLRALKVNDVLCISTDNLDMLKAIRKQALKNELPCKLVFDSETIEPRHLIAENIFDVYKVEETLRYAHQV